MIFSDTKLLMNRAPCRRCLGTAAAVLAVAIICMMISSAAATRATVNALPDAPPLADAPESFRPGLALTFESAGKTDTRVSRLVSIAVPAGTPPTPFLAAGPFKATWEGDITVPLRGDFVFSVAGSGKISVKIGEKVALEITGENLDPYAPTAAATRLKKGKDPIVVTYESPAKGDATIRLYWSSPGEFLPEPIDSTRFTHNASAKPIATATRLRAGRELFAELRCAKCHAVDSSLIGETGMPEMAMDAPSLEGIGGRLNEAWLSKWIANPHALRPDTSMPAVFPPTDTATASDIAAFLASSGAKAGDNAPLQPNVDDVRAGAKLIANLGCIGCHSLPDAKGDSPAGDTRIAWRNVRAKYKPAALVAFLKQPEEHFQWIRMPNFHLSTTKK